MNSPSAIALITTHANELLDAAPDAMIIVDSSGIIVYANQQVEALFGYSRGEIVGKQMEMLLPERFRSTHPEMRAAYARSPRLRPMGENRKLYARHRNGSEFRVEIRLSALETDEGLFITGALRGVTARADLPLNTVAPIQSRIAEVERPEQADRMIKARERAQATLNSIGDALISTDLAGHVDYLNPVAEKMTGWSCAAAIGKPLQEVLKIIDDWGHESGLSSMQSTARERHVVGRLTDGMLTRRDGVEVAVEHSEAPMQNDQGEIIGALMVLRDVTVTRAIAQKLAYAAQHDPLTGLPNRVLLVSRLKQAIALAARHNLSVAVLFLDLDRFKAVNDSLGHLVGDRLLESVARRLQRCVRSADTASRFGGDEFVVLLSEISRSADAVIVAQKILDALREPHAIDQHSLVISASIGIGLYPDHCGDPETLLKYADEAMFSAKRQGGNTYQLWSRSEPLR